MTTKNMGQEGFVWFFGIVEDTNDPLKLGRMRVRPIGGMDTLKKEELHWATPVVPITSASLAGVGVSPTGIEVGSYVVGWYLDGTERQKPIVFGSINKIPEMDMKKHDVNALAREEQVLKKTLVGPEPKSAYEAKYPLNKVISTKSGHAIEIDDTEGKERIHVYHKSGTYTEINSKGRQVNKVVDDKYQITVGDDTVYVKGNWKVDIQGDATITVKKNCSITAQKDVNVTAKGNVNIKGKKINLNG